ncbi:MAG: S-layer homology domain-containing protein [Clostridia bacterium]|nr:S-layer homology domain-containing protein [Clostridia bacterium]
MKNILKKAKRTLSLLLVLLMVVPMTVSFAVPASADDIVAYGVEGGNIYFDMSTGTVTACDGSVTKADIPLQINGVSVTSIGEYAFAGSEIEKIYMYSFVTSIAKGAFSDNDSLKDVYYYGTTDAWENVSIGDDNYYFLNSNIHWYETITHPVEGGYIYFDRSTGTIFDCDESVTSAKIPSFFGPTTVTDIDRDAFKNCSSLTYLSLPAELTNISGYHFRDCSSLERIVPDGGNSEPGASYLLENGPYIDMVTLPYGSGMLGENYTNVCITPAYKGRLEFSSFYSSAEYYLCYNCDYITEVDIESRWYSIPSYAFFDCDSLEQVTINGQREILYRAFADCSSLTSITFGASVTKIEDYAFEGCNSLTDVYYDGTPEKWQKIKIGKGNEALLNAVIHYSHEHVWGEWYTVSLPTCGSEGVNRRDCETCGEYQESYTPITGDAHVFGEWVVVLPPVGCSDGEKQRFCANCDTFETQVIPATGEHILGEWIVYKPATPLVMGEKARYCNCGYNEIEYIPVLSDTDKFDKYLGKEINFNDVNESDPYYNAIKFFYNIGIFSAYDDGNFYPESKVTRAELCALLYRITLVAGHDTIDIDSSDLISFSSSFSDVDPSDPHLVEMCWAYYTGLMMGTSSQEFSPKGTLNKSMMAVLLERCIVCFVDIPYSDNPSPYFNDSDLVPSWSRPSVEYLRLSGLAYGDADNNFHPKKEITRRDFISIAANLFLHLDINEELGIQPPLHNDHTHSYELTETKYSTCIAEGYLTYTCSCGDSYNESIPATGEHAFGEWTVTVPAGCATDGEEKRTCANCDASETQVITATGEHSYGEWTVTVPATCATDGEEKRTCANCDAFETKVITATGEHSYGEWEEITPPTATEPGVQQQTCSVCGAVQTKEIPVITPEIENPFNDVPEGQWYTDAILYCYEKSYMAGVSDTEFGRKSNVTRARFVTILAKIDNAELSAYEGKSSFVDVAVGKWYASATEWALVNGYTSGIAEGYFGYKNDVTREQLATFFYTYSEKKGYDVSGRKDLSGYSDLDRVHGWALDTMSWAVDFGLISGTSATTLAPRNSATRAELAVIVQKYAKSVKE